jgi:tRNA (guanine-N7-)-methyltransferase
MRPSGRQIPLEKLPRIDFDFAAFTKWRDRKKSLVVEIGCGVGFHPIAWAKENPTQQILAIERTTEKFLKFTGRLKNHRELKNIWSAHADAAVILPQLITSPEVSEYFFLYPNPEPKAANRRLGRSPLLRFIFSTLAPGGRLSVATNIESYAKELLSSAEQMGFANCEMAALAPTATPRSHFEKKYLSRGETCWNLQIYR